MFSTFNNLLIPMVFHYDQLLTEVKRYFKPRIAECFFPFNNPNNCFDVVVIGGGIVGAATARQLLLNHPDLKMAILEKESQLGMHQTGHNSGVIHAGIYYAPGSNKAKLCVEGSRLAYEYFNLKKIPYKRIGKLIVACDESEVDRLRNLYERSQKNKVPGVQMLQTPEQIAAIEPNCRGLAAIWSPNTGIVDWGLVNKHYGIDFEEQGGRIFNNFEVVKFEFKDSIRKQYFEDPVITGRNQNQQNFPIVITSRNGQQIHSRYVITAAGLYSDKVARLTKGKKIPQIVPFRGEYLVVKKERSNIVKTNIYPVPDSRFPFLGVHFTPRMDGTVWVGPNAILAFQREGYRYSDINLLELFETVIFSGFLKLAFKYFFAGLDEFHRSVSVQAQLKKLQRFVPSLTIDDLDLTQHVSGVRAQALDENGNMVDDFVFELDETSGRIMHVRNAPSPGATSSLAIAKWISEKARQNFNL